jgi:hypothetical protein
MTNRKPDLFGGSSSDEGVRPDPSSGWIEDLLAEAQSKRWCVKIGCTTCGAGEFRKALKFNVNPSSIDMSLRDQLTLTPAEARSVIQDLRLIVPGSFDVEGCWTRPVMLMLFQCWWSIGEADAREEMPTSLRGSFAGRVLDKMIEHYDRVTAAREEYRRSQSPEAVAARRAAKKAEKQRRHAERLELKKKRDAEYWASRGGKTN